MANAYWIISNTGAIGGGKRVRVELSTLRPETGEDMPTTPVSNAKVSAVMDSGIKAWSIRAHVRATETDALYFTLAELDAIRNNPSAAARKLKVQLHDATIIDALWTAAWRPVPALGNTIDGTDGWHFIYLTVVKYV